MTVRSLVSAAAVLLVCVPVETAPAGDPARALLTTWFALTPRELAHIETGQVFCRTLDVRDSREVATLGVVRVSVTPQFYVERLADIAAFKRDDAVLQIGAFGSPPDLGNVAHLTLEDFDLQQLRACRVGNCGMQLPAAAIERFRRDIDWRDANAAQQANQLMRRILVDYVKAYVTGGSAATMEYEDRSEPLNLRREFASLTESAREGQQYFPLLFRHLLEYPAHTPAAIDDLLYWSKERVGRRAVISVTHVAIARTVDGSVADYVIGSKHIYGSHYYDASLGLTVLIRDRSGSMPATYLAYLNRSRVDVFSGLFGGLARKMVTSRARSTVSDQLARIRRTLEREFVSARADEAAHK